MHIVFQDHFGSNGVKNIQYLTEANMVRMTSSLEAMKKEYQVFVPYLSKWETESKELVSDSEKLTLVIRDLVNGGNIAKSGFSLGSSSGDTADLLPFMRTEYLSLVDSLAIQLERLKSENRKFTWFKIKLSGKPFYKSSSEFGYIFELNILLQENETGSEKGYLYKTPSEAIEILKSL